MKKNVLFVAFTQLIAARTVNVKNANGEITGTKEIPARTVEVSFKEETDKEVTAKSFANWFICKVVPFQRIQVLNGKDGFQTSKPMTITMQINKKQLSHETKFTINPDRLLKCLERNQNLVRELVLLNSSPAHGATDAKVHSYLLSAPQNVVLAKSKKDEPELKAPAGELQQEMIEG